MRAVKSVSIDSERRVIITYLDGSTETLYPNCIWCDSEALRQLIKDLLEEKADAITQTIENVTVATFSDGADEGMIKKLLVSIEPIQEGTGDPSPENVRPISGRTGLTVYHSGTDMSDPTSLTVSWENEAGTVYGGTLDAVSGKLVVDCVYRALPGISGTAVSESVRRWFTALFPNYRELLACDSLKASETYTPTNLDCAFFASNRIIITPSWAQEITTVEEFNTLLTEHPVNIVVRTDESTEIQLTPQEVTTLLGNNNIWVDSGNILELEYTADTKLYIGEQQSGTSGTLGSGMHSITLPDIQPVTDKTVEEIPEEVKEE